MEQLGSTRQILVKHWNPDGSVWFEPYTPYVVSPAKWRALEKMTLIERCKLLGAQDKNGIFLDGEKYRSYRDSFYRSKEWKEFTQGLKSKTHSCKQCGRDKVKIPYFQVHHKKGYEISQTVIVEGFLEALNHPERFEVLCSDCHNELMGLPDLLTKNKKGRSMEEIRRDVREFYNLIGVP